MASIFSRDRLLAIVASTGFFILVSIPSIKLIYSSSIFNVLPLVIFAGVWALGPHRHAHINKHIIKIPVIIFLFACLFVLYSLTPDSSLDAEDVFKYMFFVLYLLLIVRLRKIFSVPLILNFILIWGVTLAVGKIVGVVQPSKELNQTYLTLGLPLGAALTIALMSLQSMDKKIEWFLYLGCVLIILYALLFSRGRSNIMYPFITVFLFIIRTILANKKKRLSYIILMILGVGIVSFAFIRLSSSKEFVVFDRIERAQENTEGESRYYIWTQTVDFIKKNPFGYGIESYTNLTGSYPHNIFLETTLSMGVFGLFLLVWLLILFAKALGRELKILDDRKLVILAAVGIYFFMVWNTSFDFTTSYIPLSVIILFYLKSNLKNINSVSK